MLTLALSLLFIIALITKMSEGAKAHEHIISQNQLPKRKGEKEEQTQRGWHPTPLSTPGSHCHNFTLLISYILVTDLLPTKINTTKKLSLSLRVGRYTISFPLSWSNCKVSIWASSHNRQDVFGMVRSPSNRNWWWAIDFSCSAVLSGPEEVLIFFFLIHLCSYIVSPPE